NSIFSQPSGGLHYLFIQTMFRVWTRDWQRKAVFFFLPKIPPMPNFCSGACGRRCCCGGTGTRGTYGNTQFSESADMMPDHPLPLVLVENWHPLVLVGLAGFESLIDETQ